MPVELSEQLDFILLEKNIVQILTENSNNAIQFCLICNLFDSSTEIDTRDEDLLFQTKKIIDRINARHNHRVMFIVRNRKYDKNNMCFMVRNKKAGSLEDVITYVREKTLPENCSIIIDIKLRLNIPYLFIMDFDTKFPHKTRKGLILIADKLKNKGYGMAVPRNIVSTSSDHTRYVRYISNLAFNDIDGIHHLDDYFIPHWRNFYLYEYLFDNAIFWGKGLLIFENYNFVPKNLAYRVTSHDIAESGYNKSFFASELYVINEDPPTEKKWMQRYERWVGGDWLNTIFFFKGKIEGNAKLYVFNACTLNLYLPTLLVFTIDSLFYGYYLGLGFIAYEVIREIVSQKNIYCVWFYVKAMFQKSFFGVRACIKALIRQYVTHKNYMEWQVTGGTK